jgi:UDP-N-acetylmuramoyl-tripeptide--D-alanyl-D-alanine ligase
VGEIAMLCSIAKPTHGFITNIGKAHIGTFGGFENIIRGKSELYQHLIHENGTVFINSQNPILANMAKRFKSPIFYPSKGDFYHCSVEGSGPMLCVRAENGEVIQTQLAGAYNFENAAVALCIGKFFGVDPAEANKALAAYSPGNMRSQVMSKGSNTIILDAYNANPSSMEAAIENLAAMDAPHKVAIVGNMYELEEEAEKEHRKIGTLLSEKNIQRALLVGDLMQVAKATYPQGNFFKTKDELVDYLKKHPIENSVVLIKASRGMALETILEVI